MTCCENACNSDADHEVALSAHARRLALVYEVEGERIADQIQEWMDREGEE